jgi:lysyl-tRNA synthetase class 1
VEGAGKDHSTKGGARDVANAIAKEVFGIESPHDVPYEFFLDKDGKKMSSSKGRGTSSREIADNFPPTILRLALIGKDRSVQTSIDPQGELLALLYDWHDKLAEKFWDGVGDDDARLFELLYHGHPPTRHYLPRFSTVTFVCQMTHLNPYTEFTALKEGHLTDEEKRVIDERIIFAQRWLETYAPDKYKFILQKDVPASALGLSSIQKQALAAVLVFVESRDSLDGPTFHTELHDIKTRLNIPAKELFSALYLSFLGRDSGPQAGWFLSTLDKSFLVDRLRAVV